MQTKPIDILVVDDEARMCRSLQILLSEELSCNVDYALNYYEAVEKFSPDVKLVIADLTMPGKSGLELLQEVKKINPLTEVIMMTAYSTVESAIQAIREGARDYLIKPFKSEKLLAAVDEALSSKSTIETAISEERERERFGDIIGSTKVMQKTYELIDRASKIDAPVLITGEQGTGKNLVANAIHYHGLRKRYTFMPITCSAFPDELLHHEIFGYEKGSLAGATKAKKGKVEGCHGGSLFMDQIDNISPAIQLKLFNLLNNGESERYGGSKAIPVDVRLIASASNELYDGVEDGRFRSDLYYGLSGFVINLPPLRARREDIPLLIEHFVKTKAQQFKVKEKSLSKGAEDLLLTHPYPGNVRELETIIERALLVSTHRSIHKEDLTIHKKSKRADSINRKALPIEDGWKTIQQFSKEMERELIERAMMTYKGFSNSEIAKLLGTSRRILELRLKEYQIDKT